MYGEKGRGGAEVDRREVVDNREIGSMLMKKLCPRVGGDKGRI